VILGYDLEIIPVFFPDFAGGRPSSARARSTYFIGEEARQEFARQNESAVQ
jgi:hypothetical protein